MVMVSGEMLGFISFNPTELNHAGGLALRFNSGNFFASQAAMGAGVIGYVIGLYKGRSQSGKNSDRKTLE